MSILLSFLVEDISNICLKIKKYITYIYLKQQKYISKNIINILFIIVVNIIIFNLTLYLVEGNLVSFFLSLMPLFGLCILLYKYPVLVITELIKRINIYSLFLIFGIMWVIPFLILILIFDDKNMYSYLELFLFLRFIVVLFIYSFLVIYFICMP